MTPQWRSAVGRRHLRRSAKSVDFLRQRLPQALLQPFSTIDLSACSRDVVPSRSDGDSRLNDQLQLAAK